MAPKSLAALVLTVVLATLSAGSAHGQTRAFHDPAGDGFKGHALDITGMVIANDPHHVRVTISFVRVTQGDFAVTFKRPGHGLLGGVYSVHSPAHTKSKLYSVGIGVRPCKHLVVTWEPRPDKIRVVIPSHCLAHGKFGDIKAQMITEIGSDADYFPNPKHRRFGWTRPVARG